MKKTRSRRLAAIVRITLCMVAAAVVAYQMIDRENRLTALKRSLPQVEKQWRQIEEEKRRLKYLIDSFESPLHLMELSKKPEFGYLKYPYNEDILIVEEVEP